MHLLLFFVIWTATSALTAIFENSRRARYFIPNQLRTSKSLLATIFETPPLIHPRSHPIPQQTDCNALRSSSVLSCSSAGACNR